MNWTEFKQAATSFGKVRYIAIGPDDGEPILFSTGGGAGINSVYAFEWLAHEGFRVIAVNRPGYYDMPVDIVNSIAAHADIYHEVITHLEIHQEINVFGISMGGLAALYYAKKYPTKSLVLWSAITGKYQVNKEMANSPIGKLVLSNKGKAILSWMLKNAARFFPKATIQSFLKTESNLNAQQRKTIAKEVIQNPQSKQEFVSFIDSMLPMADLYVGMMDEVQKACKLPEVNWADIQCPVLAVHSTADIDVPIEHAKRLPHMISNIEMSYVVAGGHFVWWGKEGETIKEMTKGFFTQHR